jgi:hypothetical protein
MNKTRESIKPLSRRYRAALVPQICASKKVGKIERGGRGKSAPISVKRP